MRGPFIMFCSLISIIGYAMLYATSPKKLPGVGYAGSILAALGIFPTIPLMLAWGSGNAGGSLKKGVTIGLQSGIGNLGGYGYLHFLGWLSGYSLHNCDCSICSSFIYRTQDTPRFHLGHGIVIGFLCVAFIGSWCAIYIYDRMNKAKEQQCIKEGINVDNQTQYAIVGCDSPLFRYAISWWLRKYLTPACCVIDTRYKVPRSLIPLRETQ